MAYKVTGIDNRGTKGCPFGFVYIANGKHDYARIGFGSHRDNPDPLALWACHETPDNIDPITIDRAKMALAEAFPHLAKKED